VNCRECAEFLGDYVAGELPPDQLGIFELHLSRCRNCAEYMQQYRATIVAGRVACNDPHAEAEIPEELVRAILAARAIGRGDREG
jgi:anti-sigma factor RsiW